MSSLATATPRKPRILLVGPLFPRGGGMGMVNQTLLESEALNRCFEFSILDTGRDERGAGKESSWAAINLWYFARQAAELVRRLIVERPEIVHQSISWGLAFWKEACLMLLARLSGAKVVGHVHGSELDVQIARAHGLTKRVLRRAFRLPHVLVVLSEHWRALLAAEISPDLSVQVIPNSVDRSIADVIQRAADRSDPGEPMVLFLGWLGWRKGLLDALEAARVIWVQEPGVRFVFAGKVEGGAGQAEIERACRSAAADGPAEFPGLVTGQAKVTLLQNASLFLLPSYHENLPVAIIEAMSLGLPVVSTAVAGIPEMVEDGVNGFLVQPGDPVALADRILRLVRDQDLRRRMNAANREKARREYSPEVFAERFTRVYQELLAGAHGRGMD